MLRLPLSISPVLDVAIGDVSVTLTPRQGLTLAEDLTRKAFRRVMTEEAQRHGVDLYPLAPRARPRRGAAA